MLALLDSLLGLFASFLPRVLGYFENKQNHVHELELIDKHAEVQLKLAEVNRAGKMEELTMRADTSSEMMAFAAQLRPTGIAWVDALNALVRPTLALAFFFLYAVVKYAMFVVIGTDHANWAATIVSLWGEEDWAIFASVVTFYFGNRTFNKITGKR